MTIEELLILRYKCIAPMPFDRDELYNVGDIFTDDGKSAVLNQNGRPVYPIEWAKYPHLFQRLEWWQERKPDELPLYVKSRRTGVVYALKVDYIKNSMWLDECELTLKLTHYEPATEADYNAYLTITHSNNK